MESTTHLSSKRSRDHRLPFEVLQDAFTTPRPRPDLRQQLEGIEGALLGEGVEPGGTDREDQLHVFRGEARRQDVADLQDALDDLRRLTVLLRLARGRVTDLLARVHD